MNSDAVRWERVPGRGKYARAERERRFLVDGDLPPGRAVRRIEDRYLDGTRLRLRCVSGEGRSAYKLTQKVRTAEADPSEVFITSTYLSKDEHRRLAALPGMVVVKTRAVHPYGGRDWVVDEFHGPLESLRLAEVELAALDEAVDLPPWVGAEVTHDDRWSGGRLARLDARQLAELVGRPGDAV